MVFPCFPGSMCRALLPFPTHKTHPTITIDITITTLGFQFSFTAFQPSHFTLSTCIWSLLLSKLRKCCVYYVILGNRKYTFFYFLPEPQLCTIIHYGFVAAMTHFLSPEVMKIKMTHLNVYLNIF